MMLSRKAARRNILVSAVNAGLDQGIFTLEPDGKLAESATYRFEFPGGIPAIAYAHDIGWDELSIHVALFPTEAAERWIACGNAGLMAGDAFATGWLERRTGRYLQDGMSLKARRSAVAAACTADIVPAGYADHGKMWL